MLQNLCSDLWILRAESLWVTTIVNESRTHSFCEIHWEADNTLGKEYDKFYNIKHPLSGREEIPAKFHFGIQRYLVLVWICPNPAPVAIYNVIKW